MANPSDHYKDVEEAYIKLSPELFGYAKKNLIEKDLYIDAVNQAFIKVLIWIEKHPDGHISYRNVYRLVLRQCRLMNRHQHFVSLDDPAFAAYFRTV